MIIIAMLNKRIILLYLVIISLMAYAGCAKKTSGDDKVLAKVSNKFITLQDFKARLAKMPQYYQSIIDKNKKRYLDDMIVETLFYEEAIRKGVDRDKELIDIINEAKKKIIIAKFIKNEVEDKIKVPEDEMRQFYEANKDKFKTPELWRASHILVANEKEAQDILAELSQGASFDEMAKFHSMDATASRGGDIGYFRVGQLVPDFEKECLKLNVGQVSDIVHTQFGYHIIKLTDKKEPASESYEKVKRVIEGELKKKKRSELFDTLVADLKKKYGVDIKEDVFESLNSIDKKTDTEKGAATKQ